MKRSYPSYFIPVLHLLLWSLVVLVPLLFLGAQPFMAEMRRFLLVTNVYHIFLFYANAYALFPLLASKRNWPYYIASLVAILLLSFYLKVRFLANTPFHLSSSNFGLLFFPPVVFLAAGTIYRMLLNQRETERKQAELKAETLSSQLKFLRSQVSPHFLFNMMTSMVSLARQKSDLLEPALINLSELLRYILYESDKEKISITTEIQHVKDYIALQQLRFHDLVSVNLKIDNECEDCEIEPMLIIPFIENAFKHGLPTEGYLELTITFSATTDLLNFMICNNYKKQTKTDKHGIGISNVRTRLDLLYPGKHVLEITNLDNVFCVHLKIDLKK